MSKKTTTQSDLVVVLFVLAWVGGFVLANGFWSTICCINPFWAFYLVIEQLFISIGWVIL